MRFSEATEEVTQLRQFNEEFLVERSSWTRKQQDFEQRLKELSHSNSNLHTNSGTLLGNEDSIPLNRLGTNSGTLFENINSNSLNRLDVDSSNLLRDNQLSSDINLGFSLKSDTYDGTTSLKEFLNQFDLIANANGWNSDKMLVALGASLRGKATSVFLDFKEYDLFNFEH